jgi:hypothetical protein
MKKLKFSLFAALLMLLTNSAMSEAQGDAADVVESCSLDSLAYSASVKVEKVEKSNGAFVIDALIAYVESSCQLVDIDSEDIRTPVSVVSRDDSNSKFRGVRVIPSLDSDFGRFWDWDRNAKLACAGVGGGEAFEVKATLKAGAGGWNRIEKKRGDCTFQQEVLFTCKSPPAKGLFSTARILFSHNGMIFQNFCRDEIEVPSNGVVSLPSQCQFEARFGRLIVMKVANSLGGGEFISDGKNLIPIFFKDFWGNRIMLFGPGAEDLCVSSAVE